jgi:SAM-dependent methyltransferase
VLRGRPERIPADDASFDVVVTIDVHEHLADCGPFSRELFRVTRPGGTVVVTTPNGDERKIVTRLKNAIGMTKERYGHHVVGYTVAEHERMLEAAGFRPVASGGYSRFFTEMIELGVNWLFVMVLGKKKRVEAKEGQIAPTTGRQLSSVKKQFRVWSALFPVLWTVSRLDVLDPAAPGYAVSVVGRRPS